MLVLFYTNGFIIAGINGRTDGNDCLERKTVVGEIHDIKLCLVNGRDAGFFDRGFISCGERDVDGVLIKHVGAVHFFNHFTGRFTAAEPGDGNFADVFAIRLLAGGFKFIVPDANLQFYCITIDFFVFLQFHTIPHRNAARRCDSFPVDFILRSFLLNFIIQHFS